MNAEKLTQREAARRLKIGERQLRKLTTSGAVTRDPDGRYNWPAVRDEYRAHVKGHSSRRSAGYGDAAFQEARARRTAVQARLLELEEKARIGELMPVDLHLARLGELMSNLRAFLNALPGQYAATVLHKRTMPEGLAVLRDIKNDVLNRLNAAADAIIPPGADQEPGDTEAA